MTLGNTAQRILVSVIAIPLIITISYWGRIPFLVFISFIGLISFVEFTSLAKGKGIKINQPLGITAVVFLIINAYLRVIGFYEFVLIVSLLTLFAELFRNRGSAILNTGTTLLGILYIGFFAGSVIMIRELFNDNDMLYYEGGYLIISILVTIWVCDSAAFFLGKAFGRHRLFPRVSPKKSIEGAIAGFIFSIITMIALKELILDFFAFMDIIVIGIIIGIFGQIGDLVESLLKRDSGVKDSSNIIPGHGGIFDRFDSFLFSSPIIYLYLHFAL